MSDHNSEKLSMFPSLAFSFVFGMLCTIIFPYATFGYFGIFMSMIGGGIIGWNYKKIARWFL